MATSTQEISFQTSDNVTLRGLLMTPTSNPLKLPCLILTQGFTLTIRQSLPAIATHISSSIPVACLLYDHRGFGASDTSPSSTRSELLPYEQISDLRDAITYAQTLPNIDPSLIALWGYSYSGGHALHLAASDPRIKAVIAHAPLISGPEQAHRMIPTHHWPMMTALFAQDRLGRMNGDKPMTMPVVAPEPSAPCAIPGLEAWDFCQPYLTPSETEREDGWRNEVTLRSLEEIQGYTAPAGGLAHITPTPVLMGVAKGDMVAPVDLLLRYAREMCEPKEVVVVEGGHFDLVAEGSRARRVLREREVEFLRRSLLGEEGEVNGCN